MTSRVAKNPVTIPSGVEFSLNGKIVTAKNNKTALTHKLHDAVTVAQEGDVIKVEAVAGAVNGDAQAGTARSIINNMMIGLSKGFEKKLKLVGVGYRAKSQGKKLDLSLGFSHPVNYILPEGITIDTPSQTEIIIKGADKQVVGQVAAEIRHYRPQEPYKGKGVCDADKPVKRKEGKKK